MLFGGSRCYYVRSRILTHAYNLITYNFKETSIEKYFHEDDYQHSLKTDVFYLRLIFGNFNCVLRIKKKF